MILLTSGSVTAGGRKLGTAGAPELMIPMGARSVGMAGANIANVYGTEALYWNPAGLSQVANAEANFSYLTYFADMNISYVTAAIKAGSLGVIGLSLQTLDIGKIEVTTYDVPEGTGEAIEPNYITAGLSFATALTNRILFGLNTKLISEQIGNMSARAVAWDIGLQYHSDANLDFGVVLRNIGSQIQFDGTGIEFDSDIPYSNPNATTRKTKLDMGSHELPTMLGIGMAYRYNLTESHMLNLTGQYLNSSYSFDQLVAGVEYSFRDMFFIRGGYNNPFFPDEYSSDSKDDYQFGLHFGAGMMLNIGGSKLHLDYAYRDMDTFAANNYFTVGFEF